MSALRSADPWSALSRQQQARRHSRRVHGGEAEVRYQAGRSAAAPARRPEAVSKPSRPDTRSRRVLLCPPFSNDRLLVVAPLLEEHSTRGGIHTLGAKE